MLAPWWWPSATCTTRTGWQFPGENLPHVSHYFRDPHDYFRRRLLIVGGKNSAAEAALRCWRAGAAVTISYRRPHFDQQRIKHWLLPDLEAQIEAGAIGFLPETLPVEITPRHVVLAPTRGGLSVDGAAILHATDFVLLNTGFHGVQTYRAGRGQATRPGSRACVQPRDDGKQYTWPVSGRHGRWRVFSNATRCLSRIVTSTPAKSPPR